MLPKNDSTKPAVNTTDREKRFLALMDKHKGILYKVSNAYCRDSEDRKDLIQEIMAQLWHAFDRYDSEYRFSIWMYRVALNVAIGFYRKETRRTRSISRLPGQFVENIVGPEEGEASSQIVLLYRVIDGLKRLDRALMLLYLSYVFLGFKVFFNLDLCLVAHRPWLIVQLMLSVGLVVPAFWLYRELGLKTSSHALVRRLIMDTGGRPIVAAVGLLEEIETFEQEI